MSLAEFAQYYPVNDSHFEILTKTEGLNGYNITVAMGGNVILIHTNGINLLSFSSDTKREILAELNARLKPIAREQPPNDEPPPKSLNPPKEIETYPICRAPPPPLPLPPPNTSRSDTVVPPPGY